VPGYIVVQLIGATLAALCLHAVINVSASYGANYPASGYSAFDAFLMEAVLTLGLVSVILGTASGARTSGSSARSASARTLRSLGCGGARFRERR
jgi:aquaporin Z